MMLTLKIDASCVYCFPSRKVFPCTNEVLIKTTTTKQLLGTEKYFAISLLEDYFGLTSIVVQSPAVALTLRYPWTTAHQAPCPSPSPGVAQVHIHYIGDYITRKYRVLGKHECTRICRMTGYTCFTDEEAGNINH